MVYATLGLALGLDAFAVVFYKKFKAWPVIYALDALFVSILVYKTGDFLFSLLFLAWMVHIIFAGVQFGFKGAVLQGLWTSLLFSWVFILSPHFVEKDISFFIVNSSFFLLTSVSSIFFGNHFHVFQNLLKKIASFWASPSLRINWDFSKNNWNKDFSLEKLDCRDVISSAVKHVQSQDEFLDIQINLPSSLYMFGDKNSLEKAFSSLILWFFNTYGADQKIYVSGALEKDCVLIFIKNERAFKKENPLSLLNWLKGMSFIYKVIERHGGEIKVQQEENSVCVELPLRNYFKKSS